MFTLSLVVALPQVSLKGNNMKIMEQDTEHNDLLHKIETKME